MSESYRIRNKVKALRERGRKMAIRRWQIDRQMRNRIAALNADQFPARIVRRIVVIDDEKHVKEATFWNWESRRDRQRKMRNILRR